MRGYGQLLSSYMIQQCRFSMPLENTIIMQSTTNDIVWNLVSYPLGPTNPYFLPNVICSSALTNKSFPRADIENLSI